MAYDALNQRTVSDRLSSFYLAECGLSEIEEGSRKDFILENFDISDEEAVFFVGF